ncbi:Zn-finger domain of CDGSH type-containing protein [Sporobacter termitidis DSM 10068]|uniref:Zn-finger domain of CDGSH type-containing protein n=1 Tax=Sporobacter termitidis DSM 10068 TaxID=1123282 RepID=A0A1M5YEQ1_9FIRM|nr:CDGSH iron-sulfur domain-containing protein [Sporobacter termitidis]SHI10531.1 Zn-finger domain of CDGSH type-containing protein [Sporobacter termitidis DSM 10068]
MKVKIKIVPKGPYLVTGGVPLSEKIIEPDGKKYVYKEGRDLSQGETYALCRCGRSKNPPFCDGAHTAAGFTGEETADNAPFTDRAELLRGPDLDMYDDGRCAFARFCHRDRGDAWELVEKSGNPANRREAVIAASECPAGRLRAVSKSGKAYEPAYDPAIDVLQDPDRDVSGGLFVKGGIPIESAKGFAYEAQNRVVLCRCGASRNKPFCDASHVDIGYRDRK